MLTVRDLRVHYHTLRGPVRAVDGVSFALRAGERLGLVGESGSGKSTMALALMRMIKPPGRIEGGEAILDGVNLLALSEEAMRRARLADIAMVAQGAMNSLNPVRRVRDQISDAVAAHGGIVQARNGSAWRSDARGFIPELLGRVGLAPSVAGMYPHQLSGGMKQRVCIAIAISLRPKVIVADEPTSALDVVVQRQIMETLRSVQEEIDAAVILIGHDMGLMAQFVHRLGVMYAGNLVELSDVLDVFDAPMHPYTQLLIASLPSLERKGVFQGIPGLPPSLLDKPAGCAFRARCPQAMTVCETDEPPLLEARPRRWVACHLYASSVVSPQVSEAGRLATASPVLDPLSDAVPPTTGPRTDQP
ncbi:MAG: ABC transporter ATP-binding protein [Chloroflexi bacterium]|nr:ABC transporter ATP-binding protein [Chloroflexota bacterium]